jgi:peroxiredoxin
VTTIDQTGKPLPDVELSDSDGQPVALRSFRGKPLVINIWYSTCVPCARELRDFAEVSGELGDSVQFVGVDPVDDAGKMLAFAADRGVDYPLLLDTDGKLITAAEVAAFPTTLFVSADGRIVFNKRPGGRPPQRPRPPVIVNELGVVDTEVSVLADLDFDELGPDLDHDFEDHDFEPVAV